MARNTRKFTKARFNCIYLLFQNFPATTMKKRNFTISPSYKKRLRQKIWTNIKIWVKKLYFVPSYRHETLSKKLLNTSRLVNITFECIPLIEFWKLQIFHKYVTNFLASLSFLPKFLNQAIFLLALALKIVRCTIILRAKTVFIFWFQSLHNSKI